MSKSEGYFNEMITISEKADKLLNLIQRAESLNCIDDIENCLVRIEDFGKLMERFSKIQSLYVKELAEPPQLFYDLIEKVEDISYSIRSKERKLTRMLDSLISGAPTKVEVACASTKNQYLKLPSIILPTFSGDLTTYQSFIELYTNLIHNNHNLSNVEKLYYLISHLDGEALTLVRSLKITGANYDVALNILNGRYLNNRLTAETYLKNIYSIRPVSERSSHSLKGVIDQFSENWAAFKALVTSTEEQLNLIVMNILLNKLDVATREQFELSIVGCQGNIPSVDLLANFLHKQSLALDNLVSLSNTPNMGKTLKREQVHTIKSKTSHSFVASSVIKCPFCNADHDLNICKSFKRKDPYERFKFLKDKHRCLMCFSKSHLVPECTSNSVCSFCNGRHNSLLHFGKSGGTRLPSIQGHSGVQVGSSLQSAANIQGGSRNSVDSNARSVANIQEDRNIQGGPSIPSSAFSGMVASRPTVLLGTAVVNVLNDSNVLVPVRVFIDCGSQVNFISVNCANKLGLVRRHAGLSICGLNQDCPIKSLGEVSLVIQSQYQSSSKLGLTAHILPSICSDMPAVNLKNCDWSHILNLNLADPEFNSKKSVDMLIGAELFPHIVVGNVIIGKENEPSAINTIFGYVLMGNVVTSRTSDPSCFFAETALEEVVKRFWELEEVPSIPNVVIECEQHFQQTHRRKSNGRYIVSLPFKDDQPPVFGDSYFIALSCLKTLEHRLIKNPELYTLYRDAMQDSINSGHMSLAKSFDGSNHFFIPHHAILKPDSTTTKLRIVMNASCKSSNGISLNDALMIGPKLQTDIVKVLLNFRTHRFAFVADIKKMYHQILICEEHRDFQRILWRFSPTEEVQEYVMNTVTFGVSSAPYLALRTIKQLAIDERADFPKASAVLQSDIFVDDVVTGGDSIETTRDLAVELRELLLRGGFELKKFASNDPSVLQDLPTSAQQSISFDKDEPSFLKVLGLRWMPAEDSFSFNISPQSVSCTKRSILSELARIFDPMGYLSPVVVFAKHLIQTLWTLGLDWDQTPPENIIRQWKTYQSELPLLRDISLPRWLSLSKSDECELHGFCDSSEVAYAAVVYFRIIDPRGTVSTKLMIAKSKVAPLKKQSIPRLELCAAVLLSNLVDYVRNVFKHIQFSQIVAWSYSQVVLSWIRSPSYNWKTFVANRVALIQEQVPGNHWNYVMSADNPADCASRGITPSQLVDHPLWWAGPLWLRLPAWGWPNQPLSDPICSEEQRGGVVCLKALIEEDFISSLVNRYSSLSKLKRVFSYCLRFISSCRREKSFGKVLTLQELERSLSFLIKFVQRKELHADISRIEKGNVCSKVIRKLNPFLDSENILRVGGRLRHSSLDYNAKYPILLPKSNKLTQLIISHYHKVFLHPGHSTLLALLRRQFWILSPHREINSVLSKCHVCFRANPTVASPPIMADLPVNRVSQIKAFKVVGVDFGGPFLITMGKHRGAKVLKSYLCLFVCFTTKAVHLELASDLSTESFLAALRRFLARRGVCSHIYSDCGRNFVGANNELEAFFRAAVELESFEWHFNPPASPHMGGLWEAGIKSVKGHLKKVIGEQVLTYEELSTVFVQIEALLNSRPLFASSSDPNDFQAITPNHFLNMEPLGSFFEDDVSDIALPRLSRWQKIQSLHQKFWRRWSTEYLTTLQQRNSWGQGFEPVSTGKK